MLFCRRSIVICPLSASCMFLCIHERWTVGFQSAIRNRKSTMARRIYVTDSDYVVHVCGHRPADLDRRSDEGEVYGVCERCGLIFVHKSPEEMQEIRRKEKLASRIEEMFRF